MTYGSAMSCAGRWAMGKGNARNTPSTMLGADDLSRTGPVDGRTPDRARTPPLVTAHARPSHCSSHPGGSSMPCGPDRPSRWLTPTCRFSKKVLPTLGFASGWWRARRHDFSKVGTHEDLDHRLSKDEEALADTLDALAAHLSIDEIWDSHDVEVMVVDASQGRLDHIARANPSVRWIDFTPPPGVRVSIPHQRNAGVHAALGEIIVFTDAGLHPGRRLAGSAAHAHHRRGRMGHVWPDVDGRQRVFA